MGHQYCTKKQYRIDQLSRGQLPISGPVDSHEILVPNPKEACRSADTLLGMRKRCERKLGCGVRSKPSVLSGFWRQVRDIL